MGDCVGVIKEDARSLDHGSYQLPEILNLQPQQCQESLGDSASAAVQGAPFELLSSLEIHVHKYYLHWALKSVNITYIGLFGSLGV